MLARTNDGQSEMAKELMSLGADVIEFPKWKRTRLSVDVTSAFSYDKILFAQPDSVDEFFTAVFEQRIDIRELRANLYGGSSKTIDALNRRGFLASLAEEMPGEGSLLVVGDSSISGADCLVMSKKEIDLQFLPILTRMIDEAAVETVIFPCSASIEPFKDGLRECGMDPESLLNNLKVISMGKKTLAAVGLEHAEMPECGTRLGLIQYLIGNS
jgi:uroporphyrinogen III methyltransferase/synthase